MKKRLPLALILVLIMTALVVWLEPTRVIWGTLRGEAFYQGRPTSFWTHVLDQQMEEEPEVVEWVSTAVDYPSRQPRLWDRMHAFFEFDDRRAATVLAEEAAALPVLLELLQDNRRNVRRGALDALEQFDFYPPERGFCSRRQRWDHVTGANPFVLVFGSEHLDVRRRAAVNLAGGNCPEAEAVVRELMDVLRDGRHEHPITACDALERMGPEARAAVPLLQEIRDQKHSYKLRRAAWKALQQITPDDPYEEPKL